MNYLRRFKFQHLFSVILFTVILISGNSGSAQSNPYRSLGNWGNLPDGREWGVVSWVYPDNNGNIWVLERCGGNTCLASDLDPVLKFDKEGNLVRSFGAGMFAWPHSLYVDHDGNIWVTDASGHWIAEVAPYFEIDPGKGHIVAKFSPEGEVLLTLGQAGVPGSGPDNFYNPNDVVVAPNGDVFVVDGHKPDGNHRVVKFSSDGAFIKEWGRNGVGPGEFEEPHAIDIDSQGRLFVADRGNNRIQIFDQEGNYLEQWTQFGRPSGLYIDENDIIVVADSESNYERNPGWERGIRIGSARDGWVRYFIRDTEPDPDRVGTSGSEVVFIDENGNIYGAEVGPYLYYSLPGNLVKYKRIWPLNN